MADTPDILKRILRTKAEEIAAAAEQVSLAEIARRAQAQTPARGFRLALTEKVRQGQPAVIAEIKRASPSKGVMRDPYHPGEIAESYARGGAAALSVLTDRQYFQGAPEHLKEARERCQLPLLRKDFTIDQYQIYEARAMGADAVLLIVAALGDAQLVEFAGLASHLDMDALIEVHDREELDRALALDAPLIGINNRDLRTFETTLDTTLALREHVSDQHFLVTESGIHTREDVQVMREHGINAFLVGEAFMRAQDPGERLAELFGTNHE